MPEPEIKQQESTDVSGESTGLPGSDVRADVVREHLRSVVDPELGISIVELGLVYGVDIEEDGKVNVRMTLTSPACPLGAVIQAQVHTALTKLPWVKEAAVQLVWSPRWDPHQMASEDARMQLGIL